MRDKYKHGEACRNPRYPHDIEKYNTKHPFPIVYFLCMTSQFILINMSTRQLLHGVIILHVGKDRV